MESKTQTLLRLPNPVPLPTPLLPATSTPVTKEVKIIMFQYEVIHNVLPIRTTLYRDGLIEDATCNLCNATEQTLTHLLTNCVTIAEFWTLFQNWWREKKAKS